MGAAPSESERWLRLALQAGHIGAFEADLVTGKGTWSEQLPEIWGVAGFPEDFVGYCWAHTHSEDVERLRSAYAEMQLTHAVLELEFRIARPQGVERWVKLRGQIVDDPAQGHQRLVGVYVDVTDAKQAAAALTAAEARFSVAFGASPVALAVFRASNGRFVEVNDRFLAVSGYTREEVLGKNALELGIYGRPEEREKLLAALAARGSLEPFEFTSRRKSGELLVGLSATAPIVWNHEPHFISLILDITAHKRLEEALRESQKMEAFGQLAAGVAHDFNNLLTVISVSASVAREDPEASARTAALEEVDAAVSRAKNLTRQLLTFSRRQAARPENLDLNEVVSSTVRLLRRVLGEHVALHEHYSAGVVPVHADRAMVEQVLLNLSVNARDAMPGGGHLEVETEVVELGPGRPKGRPGRFARLAVRDTGCGIAPENQGRIFEPFFTTKGMGEGTGLGLATVFGIVDQHQGWLEVESTVGKGSTFEVYLPLSAEVSRSEPARRDAARRSPEGREVVLVAEDEGKVRGLVVQVLERQGYVVRAAGSGPEALALWKAHSGEIALLLTDLVMPGGLTGTELARRLRAERPALKVLYTSGYSPALVEPEALAGPGTAFLAKPYQSAELLEAVRGLLDAR